MSELLRMDHIYYQYEEKYPALKDVSAVFHEGERIAVLGNNGAGKSTFFLCCNGVLSPQKGKIFLGGQPIGSLKKEIMSLREAVGLVFQEPDSQIIAGTVEDEVSFGPMNLRLEREEVICRVAQSLEKMNLTGYQDRAPQYLSGGEKKRVSIADILAMQPKMILLDEPTASLDPENVSILEHALEELSQSGITLVVSTHDVDFAYRFATRALVFSQGEIVADAAIDEVFASEEILSQAGLKKPWLYLAAELVDKHFKHNSSGKKPRTAQEFETYLNHLTQTS